LDDANRRKVSDTASSNGYYADKAFHIKLKSEPLYRTIVIHAEPAAMNRNRGPSTVSPNLCRERPLCSFINQWHAPIAANPTK